MTTVPSTDWRIISWTVTDGDTVRAMLTIEREIEPAFTYGEVVVRRVEQIVTNPLVHPRGIALRLINLDTPEKKDSGWSEARADLAVWLEDHRSGELRCEVWPDGGFGRVLADIYVGSSRGDTASQHMLRDRGWLPYVRGLDARDAPTSG